MPIVFVAYAAVLTIWSTTPLAIVWSSQDFTPVFAAFSRMLLAALLGTGLLYLFKIPFPKHRQALQGYAAALLGVYGSMMLTYSAAPYVPSGLMSLLFGMGPLISGLLEPWLLKDQTMSRTQILALCIALCGLGIIFQDDVVVNQEVLTYSLLILTGVFLFSLSAILVKKNASGVHPLAQTLGTLWAAVPCYALTWWLLDGQLPNLQISSHSLWAIVYLAIFGSLVGFICYYFILQQLKARTVALITLITPVFALILGHLLNQEPLTSHLASGASLILIALIFYQGGHLWLFRWKTLICCKN